jgi:RNA polymerase sigma-70 factor, ECF subfamily
VPRFDQKELCPRTVFLRWLALQYCHERQQVSSLVQGRALPWSAPAAKASASDTALSDEELLLQLRQRDEAALAELFDRYARLVFGIALRVIRDRGEAEDIVQEVFLHLANHCARFDPGKGTAKAWISHVALHKAIDRRAFLARRGFYDGTDVDLVKDILTGVDNLEASVAERLIAATLCGALAGLPRKQRLTLECFFFEGVSLREIAERTGETLVNVRHHFYRGLDRLRASPIVARLKEGSSHVW